MAVDEQLEQDLDGSRSYPSRERQQRGESATDCSSPFEIPETDVSGVADSSSAQSSIRRAADHGIAAVGIWALRTQTLQRDARLLKPDRLQQSINLGVGKCAGFEQPINLP